MSTEIKDQFKQLYELMKDYEELSTLTQSSTELCYENNTDFFLELRDFLIEQYRKDSILSIQKETLQFIHYAKFERKYKSVDYDERTSEDRTFETDNLYIVIDGKEFDVTCEPVEWTNEIHKFDDGTIQPIFYQNVKANYVFMDLAPFEVSKVLQSELFIYMKTFNRKSELEKKYPPKESLIKKIINKI